MKKVYIVPNTEIECCFAEVMQLPLHSVGQKGHVIDKNDIVFDDSKWDFFGDGSKGDNPDAKDNNLWDNTWDD